MGPEASVGNETGARTTSCASASRVLAEPAVGVHRALEAAGRLGDSGISAGVLDLRTVSPLDREALTALAVATARIMIVDEDNRGFRLSG